MYENRIHMKQYYIARKKGKLESVLFFIKQYHRRGGYLFAAKVVYVYITAVNNFGPQHEHQEGLCAIDIQ